MRSAKDGVVALAGLMLMAAALLAPAPALAEGPLQPCAAHVECGRVVVPLDRSGAVPGTVSLYVKRYTPSGDASAGTIVALAGGPGQSAVDLLRGFADDLRPVLAHRALVVFDQRGVGRSGRIHCRLPSGAPGDALRGCIAALGARRRFYATQDTVEDIEAVRAALGVERIALHGVSYGTRPALDYARAHPDHVDRLVLDSTLPAGGAPVLAPGHVAAVHRVFDGLCADGCAGLSPWRDLVRFVAGRRGGLSRRLAGDIAYSVFVASDVEPFVRASLPAALRLAARGHVNALLRLVLTGAAAGEQVQPPGLPPGTPLPPAARAARAALTPDLDLVLIATDCDDGAFPWQASDPAKVREAKLRAAAAALDPAATFPFSGASLADLGAVSTCARWPESGDAPAAVSAPLPAVPVLVLSGEDDVRTPSEDAEALVAQLPSATLLRVPGVGHSVLSTDDSGCSRRALGAFFAGSVIAACRAGAAAPVDRLPPALGRLAQAPGVPGRPGRALRGAVLTLRHDIGLVGGALKSIGVMPGTTGGFVIARSGGPGGVVLHHLSYVSGLTLSGPLVPAPPSGLLVGRLRVRVHGRSYGDIVLDPSRAVSGRLGGRRFRITRDERDAMSTEAGFDALAALV